MSVDLAISTCTMDYQILGPCIYYNKTHILSSKLMMISNYDEAGQAFFSGNWNLANITNIALEFWNGLVPSGREAIS